MDFVYRQRDEQGYKTLRQDKQNSEQGESVKTRNKCLVHKQCSKKTRQSFGDVNKVSFDMKRKLQEFLCDKICWSFAVQNEGITTFVATLKDS